ncbi:MAG TPA: hypothetical protein VFO60_01245 [Candidatus Dormibacteraeota bacterium]|nr:hypothetical protein [Candidatus Dormibacteraeota bacterium]
MEMQELLVKVPAPFSGVGDLGFSARYPAQAFEEPLRDVTLFVEGPAHPMGRLYERLRLFAEKDHLLDAASAEDELYAWTAPIRLTDEVCVMGFRDRSIAMPPEAAAPGQVIRAHVWNLVRPLAFTFLRDCVRLGQLRLAERINLVLDPGRPPTVDLELERTAIVRENGTMLLYGA